MRNVLDSSLKNISSQFTRAVIEFALPIAKEIVSLVPTVIRLYGNLDQQNSFDLIRISYVLNIL